MRSEKSIRRSEVVFAERPRTLEMSNGPVAVVVIALVGQHRCSQGSEEEECLGHMHLNDCLLDDVACGTGVERG